MTVTITTTAEEDITLTCSDCGKPVNGDQDKSYRGTFTYSVTPCEYCIDKVRAAAYAEGQADSAQ